jgi:hypothetical protein
MESSRLLLFAQMLVTDAVPVFVKEGETKLCFG